MNIKYVSELDYSRVIKSYNQRIVISKRLQSLLNKNKVADYVNLALGINDPFGNFSAAEHSLGPRILSGRSISSVFQLAIKLAEVQNESELRNLIYNENIPYLKISVGTEMAMLLQPAVHWVANTRSIWSHLLVKHGSINTANEALYLYRQGSQESEMAYKIWCAVHAAMEPDLRKLAVAGTKAANDQGIEPGTIEYIWADAIANALYERHVGS